MVLLPHSKSFYPSLRQYLITNNIKLSFCNEDRSYKSLLLVQSYIIFTLLYWTVRGVCRNIYYTFFESFPEPKLSHTQPQVVFRNSLHLNVFLKSLLPIPSPCVQAKAGAESDHTDSEAEQEGNGISCVQGFNYGQHQQQWHEDHEKFGGVLGWRHADKQLTPRGS